MTKENTNALYESFPWLYRGRIKPLTESLMSNGFDCGDGWFKLIYDLSSQITDHCQKNGIEVEAVQVKEKFGELRFYTKPWDPTIEQFVREGTKKSTTICEECGNSGVLRSATTGLKTLCDQHFAEFGMA